MIGVLVQVLSLASGLMVNFLTPLIYGVEQYGLFIKVNILVYVFHRFSDISTESLMAMGGQGSVFLQSIVVNAFYLLVFAGFSCFFDIGSTLLLGGMLLSSSVLLSLYARRNIRSVLFFLFSVVMVFFGLACLQWLRVIDLHIWQLMVYSTYPAAVVGFVVLAWLQRAELTQLSSYSSLWRVIMSLPRMVSLTLVFNCLTNFIPYIATQVLAPREIGMLRIMLSVVQSVSSIFPLNIKHIFSTLVRSEQKQRLYTALMNLSSLYFLLLTCGLLLLAWLYSPVQPYTRLLSMLPIFFCCMLTERYLQSSHRGRQLVLINLVVSLGVLVVGLSSRSLGALLDLYVGGIVLYGALLVISTGIRLPWRYGVLVIGCIAQSVLVEASVPASLAVALGTIAVFAWGGKGLRDDFVAMRGEIR